MTVRTHPRERAVLALVSCDATLARLVEEWRTTTDEVRRLELGVELDLWLDRRNRLDAKTKGQEG